ncbi:hypothetical protein [Hasllibacter sp. MH4015]|uniref:hypothetical protein n=1 Tax=Hasllibacter sp. MH4015 TaxID=2854029 RepID=UPI001CD34888|nr:hypothetical protein [Hasllibacter sp. MH4015]
MRALLALPLVIAGCVGGQGAPDAPRGPVVPILFDGGGIEAVGTGQRIDFGRDQAGVIQTMTRLQGGAPTLLPCDVAALTAARWPGGPLLVFRNGAFAGWSIPDAAQSANGQSRFGQTCAPLAIN